MVYYFSGTGNSRYVALELARLLTTEAKSLATEAQALAAEAQSLATEAQSLARVSGSGARVSSSATTGADGAGGNGLADSGLEKGREQSQQPVVVVSPVYSWGIPPIVIKFVEGMKPEILALAYFVLTCGDETGLAPDMLIKRVGRIKNALPPAIWSIIMPNNYVLLPGFDVDTKEVEARKLAEAPARIEHIASRISAGERVVDVHRGSWPATKTRLVYPLFRRWGIFPSKFRATEACISCGKCIRHCPVGNISADEKGRPLWGPNCTSCLACYHVCPVNAVQYGNATRNKGQYFFPSDQNN